ncbi:MAG: response regulator [Acidobacteriia bacterium]|nr:response regulator [Terriglobia bacterium]
MMPPDAEKVRPNRLLVVDDSRLILRMVRDFFASRGFEIAEASDGREALLRLAGWVPDVIVADILMPVMDGWELFEAVRRLPETAEVPFVFLTVESELPKRLRGFHLGADDYIVKPFAVEELHARVERLLDRRRALEDARRGGDALLAGSGEHLAISDLLQILALNHKDGVVHLRQGAEEGRIVFEDGEMVHAECRRATGSKALYRMLGWPSALFRVLPREGGAGERSITSPAANALMDGLVSLDEWNRWRELIPSGETVLDLAPEARMRLDAHEITAAEFDVMARAKGGAAVQAMLDESPLPDADLAEAICTLLTRGALRARS